VLWPHERPNPDAGDFKVVHDTLLEFFGQGVNPLEPSFLERRFLGLFGVVSNSPDNTGHLCDFMDAASKTDGDDLLYRPGFSRS